MTSVSRTLFDLAGVLSKRQLERAMHEAEVRESRDRLSLPDLLERYPRRRGTANLRALLRSKMPVGVTQNDSRSCLEGWRSLRVTWRQLHAEPAAIAADLRELLARSR